MRKGRITAVAATGDITTSTAVLKNVILTGGSDAATVVVKAGGSSGTTVLTLKAAASTSVPSGDLGHAVCLSGIHVTVTGTAPAVSVAYEV